MLPQLLEGITPLQARQGRRLCAQLPGSAQAIVQFQAAINNLCSLAQRWTKPEGRAQSQEQAGSAKAKRPVLRGSPGQEASDEKDQNGQDETSKDPLYRPAHDLLTREMSAPGTQGPRQVIRPPPLWG